MKTIKTFVVICTMWLLATGTFAQQLAVKNISEPIAGVWGDVLDEYVAISTQTKKMGVFSSKGTCTITLYKADTMNPMWSIEAWGDENVVFTDQGILVINFNQGARMFNVKTGEQMWQSKQLKCPCFTSNDMLVSYKAPASEKLCGVSLATGERVWHKKIDHASGWSYMMGIDDTNCFIMGDELYNLNYRTGETKELDCKPAIMDGKRLAGMIGAGIVAGAVGGALAGGTGYMVVPIITPGMSAKYLNTIAPVTSDGMHISNLCSMVIADGDRYYVADRDHVFCFDINMQIIWKTELPARRASESQLYLKGDTLYMQNKGTGDKPGRPEYATGMPFIATFNKLDGTKYSYLEVTNEEKAPICCFNDETSDMAGWVFKDQIVHADKDRIVRVDTFERKITNAAPSELFRFDANSNQFLSAYGENVCMGIVTEDNKLYEVKIGADHQILDAGTILDCYHLEGSWPEQKRYLLANGTDYWLVDENLAPVNHFEEKIHRSFTFDHSFLLWTKAGQFIRVAI